MSTFSDPAQPRHFRSGLCEIYSHADQRRKKMQGQPHFVTAIGAVFSRFLLSHSVFVCSFFLIFFISAPCARLSWSYRQLLCARKYIVSYRFLFILSTTTSSDFFTFPVDKQSVGNANSARCVSVHETRLMAQCRLTVSI